MSWQLIDTAPLDGTPVLVWWPAWDEDRGTRDDGVYLGIDHWPAGMTAAYWSNRDRKPHWIPIAGNYEEGWVDGEPTHWMPLPEAPIL